MVVSDGLAQDQDESYELGRVYVSLMDDVSVITLAGEVDLTMAEILNDACQEVLDRALPVRIDASRLAFIDSSGLGFLTRLIQAHPGGKPPKLVGASRIVSDTINLVGLADLVDIT